ncbi:CDP-glycerol glycerophosphotransferase family protein [Candidatus Parcubacteria bacterium]|nr:CDP-glycerol glycerophosphotransferase family protein [Candidatus Parcubacteria bacterium]
MKKPIIFITTNKAIIVRNLFLNKHIDIIKEKFDIVIFTSHYKDNEFLKHFKGYNIEKLHQIQYPKFKKKMLALFKSFHKGLIYNPTVELATLYGTWYSGVARGDVKFKFLRIFIQKYIFGTILNNTFCRDLFKSIDRLIFRCYKYDAIINKYRPELIMITNISDDMEIDLLRNCKRKNVKSVAMTKSWDNVSKWSFREKADKFMAWSDYMKDETLQFQDYKAKDIEIIGIPQFDYYKNLVIPAKDEFMEKYKMNQNKKTIFFGSEGPVCTSDPYIVSFLKQKIKQGVLKNYQIFVRPHFSYKGDEDRFKNLVDNITVFMDLDYKRSNFKDKTELSLSNVVNLTSGIVHSDIAITNASTLVLDIAANGKYPILYNFDEDKSIPFKDSTKRLYKSLWMREILKMNLDNLVDNEKELIAKIKEVENNQNFKKQELENLVKRFCYKVDGKSGERLFQFIEKQAKKI